MRKSLTTGITGPDVRHIKGFLFYKKYKVYWIKRRSFIINIHRFNNLRQVSQMPNLKINFLLNDNLANENF